LLSTGRSMRCFRGVRVSDAVAVFGTRNEFSALCDEGFVCRSWRRVVFGTTSESSSLSEDAVYCCERVVLRGLVRVAFDALGGIKIVGSFGLGFRRRAILAMVECAGITDSMAGRSDPKNSVRPRIARHWYRKADCYRRLSWRLTYHVISRHTSWIRQTVGAVGYSKVSLEVISHSIAMQPGHVAHQEVILPR
jgi:hypothetical protein